jgi:hypothetical protein
MGLPGKGVRDVDLSLSNVPWGLYSVIALSVGGNDLCSASRKPVDVVQDLMSLAQKLLTAGASKVIICQLLHRASESHFQGLDLAEYNSRVDQCNFCWGKIAVVQKFFLETPPQRSGSQPFDSLWCAPE